MKAIELQGKIDKGLKVKVFDIRNSERYETLHITNAINIERGLLLKYPKKFMTKEEKTYITCNGGSSASMIANALKIQGYNIESLEEGMNPLVKLKSK